MRTLLRFPWLYSPRGKWFAEVHGVDPDIEVADDSALLARGQDPQAGRKIGFEAAAPLPAKTVRPPGNRQTSRKAA